MPAVSTIWVALSVLQRMLAEADCMYPLETGGILAGYWAGDDVVILNASGPGPRAEHYRHRFRPDHAYQSQWIAEQYRRTERIETYLGDWHTHPDKVSAAPSWADRKTAKRIASAEEARAPRPITWIAAGTPTDWSSRAWLAELRPLLGLIPMLELTPCKIKQFTA